MAPHSAVAASYPGRRLSGDKLLTRAEPRQRDALHRNISLLRRTLAGWPKSSIGIGTTREKPSPVFHAVGPKTTDRRDRCELLPSVPAPLAPSAIEGAAAMRLGGTNYRS
jgi:hypothetical protein